MSNATVRGVRTLKSLDDLEKRLSKLEKHGLEDTLTLVEILSSISFFGSLKMEKCAYAKNGQCEFYILQNDAKKRLPIATECRIKNCRNELGHCHLELSEITCVLCPTEINKP